MLSSKHKFIRTISAGIYSLPHYDVNLLNDLFLKEEEKEKETQAGWRWLQDGDGYGSVVRGAGATADKGLCPAPGRAEDTGDFPALGEALGLSGQAGRAALSRSNSLQVEGCPSRVTTRELGSSKPAVSSSATSVGHRMTIPY